MALRIRRAKWTDCTEIERLYRLVAEETGGLARRPDEISLGWIEKIVGECRDTGLIMVLEDDVTDSIRGVIHALGSEIENLRHVMGHLSLLVDPRLQGKGLGKALFKAFLLEIRMSFKHVYRVELRARASNLPALGLYESLGFLREGLFKSRIQTRECAFEDGIPMVWFNSDWDGASAVFTPQKINRTLQSPL